MSRTPGPYPDSLAHLEGERLLLDLRLHRALLRWRAQHHPQASDDELLGLYVTEREVDTLLDGLYASHAGPSAEAADQAPIATLNRLLRDAEAAHAVREQAAHDAGIDLRLCRLVDQLGLAAAERRTVVLGLACELDRRYERLFGYLADDATCRVPTVDLALRLGDADQRRRLEDRARFTATAPLVAKKIIELGPQPSAAGLIAQGLRLDPHITDFLLGGLDPDPALAGCARVRPTLAEAPILAPAFAERVALVASNLRAGPGRSGDIGVIAITGRDAQSTERLAAHLAEAAGVARVLVVDGETLLHATEPEALIVRAQRDARLLPAALTVHLPPPNGEPHQHARAVARLLSTVEPAATPIFLLADLDAMAPTLPSELAEAGVLRLALPVADGATRARQWRAGLNGHAGDVDPGELAERYRLTPGEIDAALGEARASAAAEAAPKIDRAHLVAGCRAQTGGRLDGLAERIETIHTWDDLVLPSATKETLTALEHWVRFRGTVYRTWGFAERTMVGRGMTALFTGPSGTGKTMAAGILARRLELDLYRVDLSSVVSKYIGETEKNLSRIFDAAEASNAVLFFDEADALFGKRSEVKDAHDRYANIEVSYLLQRMESYSGVAVLASNFRDNLDSAFARRIHVTVEFPCPQAADRERIWRRLIPGQVPQDHDVDLGFLARSFALTGGHIKNCALGAAFAAAADGGSLSMRHLVQAVARELEKSKQPLSKSAFGAYHELLRAGAGGASSAPS